MAKDKTEQKGIKTICCRQCYFKGRLWNPGDIRYVAKVEDVPKHFKYDKGKDEWVEGPPEKSFSQWTKEQYLQKAEELCIEIPEDVKTRDDLKKFLEDKIDQ